MNQLYTSLRLTHICHCIDFGISCESTTFGCHLGKNIVKEQQKQKSYKNTAGRSTMAGRMGQLKGEGKTYLDSPKGSGSKTVNKDGVSKPSWILHPFIFSLTST